MTTAHGRVRTETYMGNLQPALHRAAIALDEMPAGSVVLDKFGHAWQSSTGYGALGSTYSSGYWYRAYDGDDTSEVSTWELAQRGPVTRMAPERSPARPKKRTTR